jgi:hypothetical protein
MQIDGISPQVPRVHPLGKPHPKEQKAAEIPEQPLAEQESTVQQTTESSDSDGVLRLLQEGHFKGVSDIRLRINFYNELAAIEAQQLQAVVDEQIDGILQSVGSIVGTMVEESDPEPESTPVMLPPPPAPEPQQAPAPVQLLAPPVDSNGDGVIDSLQATIVKTLIVTNETSPPPPPPPDLNQLQEDFTETVNQLKDDFLAADSPSTNTLLEGTQSAFDQLLESLELTLTPPDGGNEQAPNIEPAEGPESVIELTSAPAPAPELETAPETQPVIEDLTAAFEAALADLVNAFDEVTILTPTSEPNGNGGAYQKFLNIYNDMREGTE